MGKRYYHKNKPAVETQELERILLNLQPGEFISYEQLSEIVNMPVDGQGKGYARLKKARERLEKHDQIVIDCVPGKGVQRRDDEGIVMGVDKRLQGIRNDAAKGIRRVGCAEFNNLSLQMQTSFLAKISMLETLNHFARPSSQKKLEEKVNTRKEKLEVDETLNFMLDSGVK